MVDTPSIPVGPSTQMALVLTIVAAIGTIAAAIRDNDVATITGGVTTLLTALGTIFGRSAQSVAAIKSAATAPASFPLTVDDPEVDEVTWDRGPTNEEEFATPVPA